MNKTTKAEIVITLLLVGMFIAVFMRHDEFFALFMLELSFIAIMGIICAVVAICLMYAMEAVSWLLDRIFDRGENNADTQKEQ